VYGGGHKIFQRTLFLIEFKSYDLKSDTKIEHKHQQIFRKKTSFVKNIIGIWLLVKLP
jgi:hypothetical protein